MTLREQTGQGLTRRTLTVSLLTVGIACAFPPCVGWNSGPRNDFTRRLSAGQRLFEQGNMDAAIAEFKAAVAAQPDVPSRICGSAAP